MDDKYKLGIDTIDIQHQKIFDIINDLCDTNTVSDMEKIIKELKEYSIYHFKTEEEYFMSIEFIESETHKHLHNMFIQTMEYYSDFPEKLNKKKLYTFLNTWIKNHILIEDKKYITKEFIK